MGTTAHVTETQTGHCRAPVRVRLPSWRTDERAGRKPEGEWHELSAGFLPALKIAAPFASTHPSEGALVGVSLDGEHACASNKEFVVAVETGGHVPPCVVPLGLAHLLIKRTIAPCSMLVRDGAIAFAWHDETWIE